MRGFSIAIVDDERVKSMSPQARLDFQQFLTTAEAGVRPLPLGLEAAGIDSESLRQWMDKGLVHSSTDNLLLVPDYYRFTLYSDRAREVRRLEAVKARVPDGIYRQIAQSLGGSRVRDDSSISEVDRGIHEEFDREIWPLYPRKINKAGALVKYKVLRKDKISKEDLLAAVKGYRQQCLTRRTEDSYIMHGATFFGQNERWRDYATATPASQGKPSKKSFDVAWDSVRMEVRKVGFYGKPNFNDGHIARAVATVGWSNICSMDEYSREKIRLQFIRAMEASMSDPTIGEKKEGQ